MTTIPIAPFQVCHGNWWQRRDFAAFSGECQKAVPPDAVRLFSEELGVSVDAFQRMLQLPDYQAGAEWVEVWAVARA